MIAIGSGGRVRRGLAAGLLALLAIPAAQARIVEEKSELPVQVSDAYGKTIAQAIKVTIFRDDAASAPRPAVVINHGRASEAAERASFGRSRFADISRWFVRQGFVVALPTRIGYGETGGEDVEDAGPCNNKRFGPSFAAAAAQTLAVTTLLRERADVQPDRIVAVGQSVGGATTVAFASLNPPGLVAAINFAGGSGGDPKNRPGNPCSPQAIERTYAEYGARAKLPMLWIYAENDKYWGATWPRAWAAAYRGAGANVRFVQVPPAGEDGHAFFTRFPLEWQPLVTAFLREQGFAMSDAGNARKDGEAGKP